MSPCTHPKPLRKPPAIPSTLQHPAERMCQLGHGRNRKQNLHSLCLGRVSHLPPSHNLPPPPFLTPGLRPAGLRQCPNALAPWPRRDIHPAKGCPAPAQPHYRPLRSGKRGRCLASSQAPPATRPLPHAKGDPRVVWHSPAVPSGCFGRDGESFAGFAQDGKVPALERGGTRRRKAAFLQRLTGRQSSPAPLLCPSVNSWL